MKANGSKLWQFKYRLFGKEHLLSIGVYPDVNIVPACKAKEAARAKVAEDDDRSATKQMEKRIKREETGQTLAKIGRSFL